MNYIGPNNGQGIRIYLDGVQAGSDDTRSDGTFSSRSGGDGRVVVGALYTYKAVFYASVDVDELLFFNQKLSDKQIMDIKNSA